MTLIQQQINERMIELRNLRKLHSAARERIVMLETENKHLKARIKELEQKDKEKDMVISDLQVQMEELRTMVFGKGRKEGVVEDDDSDTPPTSPKTVRTKESYQRPVPKESEITHHVQHPFRKSFVGTRTRTKTYYVEDIPAPHKTVTKHTVTQRYCTKEKRWLSAAPLPSSTVILGDRVKRYVVYLHTIGRLSYAQIRELLSITYALSISDGEITKILKHTASQETPTYEATKDTIRQEDSIHLDETSWSLQCGDGYHRYGWGMVGGDSGDTVYTLGKTRGKGNATHLLDDTDAVVVSDDYAAYRVLEQPHQVCWAHIHRKLRDLKESTVITDTNLKQHCINTYRTFAGIYSDLTNILATAHRETQYQSCKRRLTHFSQPNPHDPAKLIRIKTQVRDRLLDYLTCLRYPNVYPDNNAAERALRHVVLKRKVSFGSFSEETAHRTAVLLSVLMTKRNRGELREWVVGV